MTERGEKRPRTWDLSPERGATGSAGAQPVCGAAGRNDHQGRWAGPGAGTVELNLREAAAQHRDDPGFFSPLTLFIGDTGFGVQPAA